MDDGDPHPGVKVIGVLIVAVLAAAFAVYVFVSEGHDEESWDTVPIGARCEILGAQERTYDGGAAFCAPFPHYGIQIWSWSDAELAVPVPTPANPRDAQIRVCMHQLRLDQRNCEAGIARYEQSADAR